MTNPPTPHVRNKGITQLINFKESLEYHKVRYVERRFAIWNFEAKTLWIFDIEFVVHEIRTYYNKLLYAFFLVYSNECFHYATKYRHHACITILSFIYSFVDISLLLDDFVDCRLQWYDLVLPLKGTLWQHK